MADSLSEQEALERAFRMLARRPHSEREIRRKLGEKGASDDDIARVLERLRERLPDLALTVVGIESSPNELPPQPAGNWVPTGGRASGSRLKSGEM